MSTETLICKELLLLLPLATDDLQAYVCTTGDKRTFAKIRGKAYWPRLVVQAYHLNSLGG